MGAVLTINAWMNLVPTNDRERNHTLHRGLPRATKAELKSQTVNKDVGSFQWLDLCEMIYVATDKVAEDNARVQEIVGRRPNGKW